MGLFKGMKFVMMVPQLKTDAPQIVWGLFQDILVQIQQHVQQWAFHSFKQVAQRTPLFVEMEFKSLENNVMMAI